jgi:hypothetical protein
MVLMSSMVLFLSKDGSPLLAACRKPQPH